MRLSDKTIPPQKGFLAPLKLMAIENIVGKGAIARNKQMLYDQQ